MKFEGQKTRTTRYSGGRELKLFHLLPAPSLQAATLEKWRARGRRGSLGCRIRRSRVCLDFGKASHPHLVIAHSAPQPPTSTPALGLPFQPFCCLKFGATTFPKSASLAGESFASATLFWGDYFLLQSEN